MSDEPITQVRIAATVARCFNEHRRWYIQFEGSWESLFIGDAIYQDAKLEPAPFVAGEVVDIIIRKRNA